MNSRDVCSTTVDSATDRQICQRLVILPITSGCILVDAWTQTDDDVRSVIGFQLELGDVVAACPWELRASLRPSWSADSQATETKTITQVVLYGLPWPSLIGTLDASGEKLR